MAALAMEATSPSHTPKLDTMPEEIMQCVLDYIYQHGYIVRLDYHRVSKLHEQQHVLTSLQYGKIVHVADLFPSIWHHIYLLDITKFLFGLQVNTRSRLQADVPLSDHPVLRLEAYAQSISQY